MPNLRGKTWTTSTPANVEDAQYWEDHLISDAQNAKITSSVQSVNNVTPDNTGNVNIVALPSGGTTGQVLMKISNTSGDADWENLPQSGHTIQNPSGSAMTDRTILQFLNAEVSDDSVNGKTVVDCQGEKGDAATVTVGTTTTLPAGSSATVTNSGTTSAAVFDFGIPKGADGADGEDGADGVSPAVTISTITGGHRVKITDKDHPSGQSFDVMDGVTQDISGKQDKTLSAQVEGQSTVEGALGALSNADKATRQLIDDTVGFVSYNVLPCTIDYLKANNTTGTWSGNTYTLNNVTFACDVNNDGSINKITVNNQASARADFRLGDNISGVNYGKSILSGCPSGGSTNTYRLITIQPSPDAVTLAIDTGSGATLPDTVSYDFYTIIRIQASYSASNLVFKPMIVKPIYADMPYQPYHASVEESKVDNSVIAPVENGATASQAYSTNDFFMHLGELYIATTSIAQGATFTVGTNCTKKTVGEILTALLNA